MATPLTKQKQKQKIMIIAFVIVLGITSFVVWKGFFQSSAPTSLDSLVIPSVFVEPKINFEFLKSEFFKDIAVPPKIPPMPEKIGRENPFLPL